MSFWKEIGRRTAHVARRAQFDRELDEEIRFHLESRIEELETTGVSHDDAVAQARREFGSRARTAEESREAWRFQWLEDLFVDLRHAARSFRRSPAFALTAIGCLALGIAANTLIFSLVNTILLRALPYPDANRLVMVRFTPPNEPDQKFGSNSGTYFFIREHNHVFESMGGLRLTSFSIAADTRDGDPAREWVLGGWVSPGLTDTMGVSPKLGRWFSKDDSFLNVVISYGLWQRMFGSSPDVLGRKLVLDLGVVTVLGVMPPGYQTLNPDIDFWRLQPDENLAAALRSPNRVFNLFARLKPGVSVEQAQADMSSLAGPLGEQYEMNRGWNIKVESLREAYVGHLRRPLLIFQGAVLILLLIACANVAGLLLAQANARHKELAVRAALGSTRARVVRQLLAESLLLSSMGGLAGVALGWAGLQMFTTVVQSALPNGVHVTMDLVVLVFALVLSLATGLIFGTLPALQISRPDLMGSLRESSRSATAGGLRQKLRGAFVVAQVALALVLLIGAGLLTHSLLRLNMVQPGFTPHGLVTFQVPFSRTLYRNSGRNTPSGGFEVEMTPRFNVLVEQVRERIANLPDVESATFAMTPPLGGVPRRFGFKKDGVVLDSSEQEAWTAEWYPVGAGYFQTLKVPLIRGRDFDPHDSSGASPVVIINDTMARRFFPNEDPIGKRIQTGLLNDQPREIVGVVGDVRQDRYQYNPQPQMYVPHTQIPAKMDMSLSFDVLVATFIMRTNGNLAALVPLLRKGVAEVDRSQAVTNVLTVEQYAAGQLQDLRHYAMLLSIFGGISILLSFIGLFGIMAHTVTLRTNEIGIRVALGATSRAVLALIARQGLALVGIGILLGTALSLTLTRILGRFLWGISATDPVTFLVVLLAIATVALIACYLPARRALRIDPIIALRME
jgi:putative ABC transport system permease protein